MERSRHDPLCLSPRFKSLLRSRGYPAKDIRGDRPSSFLCSSESHPLLIVGHQPGEGGDSNDWFIRLSLAIVDGLQRRLFHAKRDVPHKSFPKGWRPRSSPSSRSPRCPCGALAGLRQPAVTSPVSGSMAT